MEHQTVRKPRVLCLHAFRTSGKIFEKQTEVWPEFVREKMDLVFIDGPFPAEGESGVQGEFDPPYYEWFHFNKDFSGYRNFNECIAYIEDCMTRMGPFDGLLGFSQGAIISSALPGMQAEGVALTSVPMIKFVMLIAASKFGGSMFPSPKLAENAFSSHIQCPSLHFLGEQDRAKPNGIELLDSFVDPLVIHHPEGHVVPQLDEKGSEIMLKFIDKVQKLLSKGDKRDSVSTVRDVLGRWGKKVGEATKKAEDLAGNTWQHLKTAPSFADAAMGRIAQGTKVLAEGGYEKIFRQTFETVPEEQLLNSYACYLSTSAGPVMGVLYVSTAKLAFSSDNPLSYKAGDKEEWSYYKVIIPFHQLKAVNPSTSRANPAEKYIQVISVDNHEFWFMSFLNYDSAVKCLRDALDTRNLFV